MMSRASGNGAVAWELSSMEDEGGLSFDFEAGLEDNVVTPQMHSVRSSGGGGGKKATTQSRKNYRQTVCRHWLRGLCMEGDECRFLHQFDMTRMPICRFFAKFGECHEPDCIYKHTDEDIKECFMYKLGFCPNGPDCRYRHLKVQGPAPSVEQNLHRIQHRVYAI